MLHTCECPRSIGVPTICGVDEISRAPDARLLTLATLQVPPVGEATSQFNISVAPERVHDAIGRTQEGDATACTAWRDSKNSECSMRLSDSSRPWARRDLDACDLPAERARHSLFADHSLGVRRNSAS